MIAPKSESDTIQKIAPVLAQIEELQHRAKMELKLIPRGMLSQISPIILKIMEDLLKVGVEPPSQHIQRQFELRSWEACPQCGHPTYNPESKVCEVCNAESYPYGKGPFPGGEFKRRWEAQPEVSIHAPMGDPVLQSDPIPEEMHPVDFDVGSLLDATTAVVASILASLDGDPAYVVRQAETLEKLPIHTPTSDLGFLQRVVCGVCGVVCPTCSAYLERIEKENPQFADRIKKGLEIPHPEDIHMPTVDPDHTVCPQCSHPMVKGGSCPAHTYTKDCDGKQ